MGWKRVRAGVVALVALATMSAGAVTAAPAEAASTFTGVSKPMISGTRTVGKTLTAKRDTSTTPKADRVSYQWLRNGKAIAKATKSSYKLTSKDKGKKITVLAQNSAFGQGNVAAVTAILGMAGITASLAR